MATPSRMVASEPKQARAHATRRRLLDAAVEELLEHGYVGLTTQAVARRAGASPGAPPPRGGLARPPAELLPAQGDARRRGGPPPRNARARGAPGAPRRGPARA